MSGKSNPGFYVTNAIYDAVHGRGINGSAWDVLTNLLRRRQHAAGREARTVPGTFDRRALKPGELVTSVRRIAVDCGLGASTVRRALKKIRRLLPWCKVEAHGTRRSRGPRPYAGIYAVVDLEAGQRWAEGLVGAEPRGRPPVKMEGGVDATIPPSDPAAPPLHCGPEPPANSIATDTAVYRTAVTDSDERNGNGGHSRTSEDRTSTANSTAGTALGNETISFLNSITGGWPPNPAGCREKVLGLLQGDPTGTLTQARSVDRDFRRGRARDPWAVLWKRRTGNGAPDALVDETKRMMRGPGPATRSAPSTLREALPGDRPRALGPPPKPAPATKPTTLPAAEKMMEPWYFKPGQLERTIARVRRAYEKAPAETLVAVWDANGKQNQAGALNARLNEIGSQPGAEEART